MLSKGLFKRLTLFLGDSFIFWFSLYFALLARRPDIADFSYFTEHVYNFAPIFIFFIVSIFVAGLYDIPDFSQKAEKIKYIGAIVLTYILFGNTLFYFFPGQFTPKTVLLIQGFAILLLLSVWRLGTNRLQKFDTKSRALLLGTDKEIFEIHKQLQVGAYTISPVLHLHFNSNSNAINSFKDYVLQSVKDRNIDLIIVNLNNKDTEAFLPMLYNLTKEGVRIMDMPHIYEYLFRKTPLHAAGYSWFFEHVDINTKVYEFVKRVIDIIISLPVFVVWAFLHPWVKRYILSDGNPTVYSEQKRVGRYGKEIIVKKYRTMAYTDGGFWPGEKTENYITPVGAFLRKTRIDELPQILNVIKGELSLIGPRTDLGNLAKRLEEEVPYYMIRYAVTPGLSGWAQIMMHEQPQGIDDTIERLKYDLYYIKNRGILFDLIIALRTARTLLAQEGR